MSRKDLEAEAENHEWSPDLGSVLKMFGEVVLGQWHEKNGIYLNAEERKERGKRPQAEVHQSDIQVRCGNQLITFVPVDEGKAMISIPVGMSDKATPATMPREKLLGYFIDMGIEMCEGDTTIVRHFANGVNAAINNAMEVSDDGRMKVNQSKLPEFNNPIEVAEILDSFKRTYVSKSKPSTKANFTMVVQELEPVEEAPQEVEVVEPSPSKAGERVMQLADRMASHSAPKEEQVVGEDSHSNTEPEPASEEVEPTPSTDESEEVVAVVADPTPPAEEDTPSVHENPHNFKKNPTDWIKHELMVPDHADRDGSNTEWTVEEVAELAGCHVQTIKRALDKFEAEAAYVHMQPLHTLKDADEGTPGWVALDVPINENHQLRIECERSATGRYARGRPITFTVQGLEEDWNTHPEEMAERMDAYTAELKAVEDDVQIPIEALEDSAPVVSDEWPQHDPDEGFADAEPYVAPEPVAEVLDTPVAAIEQTTGRCVHCVAPATFTANTAIGERLFCTEKCWAEYTGNPVKPEGHYGLQAQHDEEVEMELEAQEEARLRAENQFDIGNAMGF